MQMIYDWSMITDCKNLVKTQFSVSVSAADCALIGQKAKMNWDRYMIMYGKAEPLLSTPAMPEATGMGYRVPQHDIIEAVPVFNVYILRRRKSKDGQESCA